MICSAQLLDSCCLILIRSPAAASGFSRLCKSCIRICKAVWALLRCSIASAVSNYASYPILHSSAPPRLYLLTNFRFVNYNAGPYCIPQVHAPWDLRAESLRLPCSGDSDQAMKVRQQSCFVVRRSAHLLCGFRSELICQPLQRVGCAKHPCH